MALALTDAQMKIITDAARQVPVEKRDLYLRRIAAMLELRCGRGGYLDTDVLDVSELALCGLIQETDAA